VAGGKSAQFAEAHAKLLADRSIQFDVPALVPPHVPAWLRDLIHFIDRASPVLRILFWAGLAALGLFLLYLIARRIWGGGWTWRRAKMEKADEPGWRPAEAPARALLHDADALAAQGRFAEAAHLLLFRSIDEIESRRPSLVRPALTSRDIAAAGPIPDGARNAFAAIVATVELSLFGGCQLDLPDWRSCRDAYERFAFAEAWR
jgi:hypothetical protein